MRGGGHPPPELRRSELSRKKELSVLSHGLIKPSQPLWGLQWVPPPHKTPPLDAPLPAAGGRAGGRPPCRFSPKVEALQGRRVVDVACGSGDAQTLCLTDDDTVWSWGDGDYGKLGRGGSDGCKVPMKVPRCLCPRVPRALRCPPRCPRGWACLLAEVQPPLPSRRRPDGSLRAEKCRAPGTKCCSCSRGRSLWSSGCLRACAFR